MAFQLCRLFCGKTVARGGKIVKLPLPSSTESTAMRTNDYITKIFKLEDIIISKFENICC